MFASIKGEVKARRRNNVQSLVVAPLTRARVPLINEAEAVQILIVEVPVPN
jgi:hypothetical protein